jgi:hypothetical protein
MLDFMHLGKLIRAELRRQEREVTWLANKLCCDRTNIYKIFSRKSIDTDLLFRISEVLDFNFMRVCADFHDERMLGNAGVGAAPFNGEATSEEV